MAMDLVDYEIKGSEMQFVEIELDPGEAAVGKIKTALFGGEGLFFARLSGPGHGMAAKPAVFAPGQPGVRRGAAARWLA